MGLIAPLSLYATIKGVFNNLNDRPFLLLAIAPRSIRHLDRHKPVEMSSSDDLGLKGALSRQDRRTGNYYSDAEGFASSEYPFDLTVRMMSGP